LPKHRLSYKWRAGLCRRQQERRATRAKTTASSKTEELTAPVATRRETHGRPRDRHRACCRFKLAPREIKLVNSIPTAKPIGAKETKDREGQQGGDECFRADIG
jgi:hypothetical protein